MHNKPDWHYERHYYPSLVLFDGIMDSLPDSEHVRNTEITLSPSSIWSRSKRLPEVVPTISQIRNVIADVCGVIPRSQDIYQEVRPAGYEIANGGYEQWKMPSWTREDARVGFGELLPEGVTSEEIRIMMTCDEVVSRIERLIWEEEYPRHNSDDITRTVIFNPRYTTQNSQIRNGALSRRNMIASQRALPVRDRHTLSIYEAPSWQLRYKDGHAHALPRQIKMSDFVMKADKDPPAGI